MNDSQSKLTRDEQDSLAPLSLDRLSVEDEAALMQGGKLGKLAFVAVIAVMVGASTSFWMKRIDTREAYVGAAASVHKLRVDKLEPFLRCALPEVDRAQINSKDRLISAIEAYGDRLGKDYGRVLSRCMPLVADLPADLAAVPGPAPVKEHLRELSRAASDLESAVGNYRTYLTSATHDYDYVQALPLMEKIAVAWESYEARQAELDAQVHTAVD
jgi:hypothetical protein